MYKVKQPLILRLNRLIMQRVKQWIMHICRDSMIKSKTNNEPTAWLDISTKKNQDHFDNIEIWCWKYCAIQNEVWPSCVLRSRWRQMREECGNPNNPNDESQRLHKSHFWDICWKILIHVCWKMYVERCMLKDFDRSDHCLPLSLKHSLTDSCC